MQNIGCYYESWKPAPEYQLLNIQQEINMIYLSFALPDLLYTKGQNTFVGTGLDFTCTFETLKYCIKRLQNRNVRVLLAVGGGSYWSMKKSVNTVAIIDLMNDLGCDGIDLDWEVGVDDNTTPVYAIDNLRKLMPGKILSYTCFCTGVYPQKPNDHYSGMNLLALQQCHKLIDQVNVMAYDAGADFDTVKSIRAFQEVYKGLINVGFMIGEHSWPKDGDLIKAGLLFKEELVKVCTTLKNPFIGCFFWAYHSEPYLFSITRYNAVITASSILNPPKKPTFTTPSSVYIQCPSCKTKIKNSWSVDNV
ncbi:MAG: glycoside hydrolase family 18 protein [Bacteroidota bacterium]